MQLHRTSTRKGGFALKVHLRLDALRKSGWPGERGVSLHAMRIALATLSVLGLFGCVCLHGPPIRIAYPSVSAPTSARCTLSTIPLRHGSHTTIELVDLPQSDYMVAVAVRKRDNSDITTIAPIHDLTFQVALSNRHGFPIWRFPLRVKDAQSPFLTAFPCELLLCEFPSLAISDPWPMIDMRDCGGTFKYYADPYNSRDLEDHSTIIHSVRNHQYRLSVTTRSWNLNLQDYVAYLILIDLWSGAGELALGA